MVLCVGVSMCFPVTVLKLRCRFFYKYMLLATFWGILFRTFLEL